MSFLDQASWVMVPSQYKEDTVRAFKPTSELGNLAFTRSSDATFTDSTGVVRRSPWNLLTFSEMFSDASWTKVRSTITANTVNAPNGTLTADTITCTETSTDGCFVRQSVSLANERTTSIYVKPNTAEYFQIHRDFGSGVVFNLTNGTVKQSVGATGTITAQADGWYRCTATFSASGLSLFLVGNSSMTVATWFSTINQSLYLWGAQLVEGTEALPYFATTDRLNVPRLDYSNADGTLSTCPRLLLEPQRTNSIRNSSMVAAVAGSPGTLPTNWTQLLLAGLTRTIVGTGTENGLPYIDIRYNGTASGASVLLAFETVTGITAATGQVWTGSFYIKTISLPNPPTSFRSLIAEYTSAGVYIRDVGLTITPTSNLNRFSQTETLAGGATTARVVNGVLGVLTIGATYDFTIRIAAPQMELGAYATTWVPTTTTAVTRIADLASKTGVSSIIGQSAGTIFWDINDLTGTTSTGNPDYGVRNTAFTNWIGITTNTFASPFRVVVRPTSGIAIDYTANITRAKAAVAWSSAGAVLYVNGVQVGTSAVNPNFSFDRIDMLGGFISYKTNQSALFPVRLDNATLAALTTL